MCICCSFTLVFVGNGGETNCCCLELKVQVRFTLSNTFLCFQSSKETLCRKEMGVGGIIATETRKFHGMSSDTLPQVFLYTVVIRAP